MISLILEFEKSTFLNRVSRCLYVNVPWCLYLIVSYGRPLLPDLNTTPNNCVRENSLWLSANGIGIWSLVRILPEPYISVMHLFICFFVTDLYVRTYRDVFKLIVLEYFHTNLTLYQIIPCTTWRGGGESFWKRE